MLTGEQPYKGEQPMQIAFQHATDSVPRPSVKNPGVPEQLDELVLWATEKVPDDRPLDAGVLLARLRDIERELGVAPQVARAVAVGTTAPEDAVDSAAPTNVLPHPVAPAPPPVEQSHHRTRLRTPNQRRPPTAAWLAKTVHRPAAPAGPPGGG